MLGDDLPFTIARFLTMSAQTGQAATQEKIRGRSIFKTRNDWTEKGIRITPAQKTKLFSEVFTDTSNRKSGAPDYLPAQDYGGEKVPVAGHHFLAIPTKYLRRLVPGIIPDALRPKNLFPAGVKVNVGDNFQGSFGSNVGGKARRAIGRDTRKKLSGSDYIAFVQHTQGGTLCIFVRHGGIAGKGAAHDAEPWYTLVPGAHIKARFPMESIVEAAVLASADKNFDRAAAEVLINNALKSGLQVRF